MLKRSNSTGKVEHFSHQEVENKWKSVWEQAKLDVADIEGAFQQGQRQHSAGRPQGKPKFYNLMMFPYPSAEGLHVGNMYAFTGSDIYGRFKRMQGFNVFEPIGLDGFGIHSENYALKIGRHPVDQAKIAEKNFYGQLQRIGAMFDWSRTVQTYDPGYYKWTQWLFIQMFKHGLAYRAKAEVNWCPSDKTVLADEQVIDGCCERCGNIVEKKLLEQWFFRITAYAGKLLENLNSLDWSAVIKTAQKNWIGKKEGINITYQVIDEKGKSIGEVSCFTTRPDTNFGATFVVIAPEHPFITRIQKVIKKEQLVAISHYVEMSKNKSKDDRIAQGREKTGIFTGLFCVNQLNGYKMPLYVSDFVVMGVGTGAVVGVPASDIRDFEFAQKMNLPIIRVIYSNDGYKGKIIKKEQVCEEGTLMNSEFLNGLTREVAIPRMMDYLVKKGWGARVTSYHLRDWLISRQRYWGPPIPMIYCKECAKEGKSWFTVQKTRNTQKISESEKSEGQNVRSSDIPIYRCSESSEFSEKTLNVPDNSALAAGWYPVPEDKLPVLLPRIPDYKPGDDGVAPLAKHKEFYETTCPGCGAKAVRETDVSDTFLDSSWYFLRYPSVRAENSKSQILNSKQIQNPKSQFSKRLEIRNSNLEFAWDREITRRWLPVDMYTGGAEHSVLHLLYSRFVWKCLLDWGYLDFSAQGGPASGWEEPFTRFYAHGLIVKEGAKMSKSKGNVVNPDEYIKQYGIDALRLYLMFMGPFNEGGDFRDSAMEGMYRWINRVWRLIAAQIPNPKSQIPNKSQIQSSKPEIKHALNKLIAKVTDDMEKRRYNTAIASMMEFTNLVSDVGSLGQADLKIFIKLLAPFAPFLAEELWQRAKSEVDVAVVANKKLDPVSTSFWHASQRARPESQEDAGQASMTSKSDMEVIEKDQPANMAIFNSVHLEPWPVFDPKAVKEDVATIIVQVNGKLRTTLDLPLAKSKIQTEVVGTAKASEQVKKYLEGKNVRKVIFVSGKLLNFVIS